MNNLHLENLRDIENFSSYNKINNNEKNKTIQFLKQIIKAIENDSDIHSKNWYNKKYLELQRKFKYSPSKSILSSVYQELLADKKIKKNKYLEDFIRNKSVRSRSGVLVVTLVMKPSKFSCPYNCHMCPDERIENGATVDMPRSYLSTEPAEMRAQEVDFDTVEQFNSRMNTLKGNNHQLDKVEIIVLGGTFSTYPRSYQREFIRDTFYAANTFFDKNPRDPYDLTKEQEINETSQIHIVGLSIETRPDQINKDEIKRLREYGVTRVQMGIQHTDNDLLEIINRNHKVEHSIKAIKKLKEVGFKVELHIMPDLPGTTPEKDIKMIDEVLLGNNFHPDYLKIYPCLDVKYTEIRKWKENGKWEPYAEKENGKYLYKVLEHALVNLQYWTREGRVQRDFPEEHNNNNYVGFKSNTIKTNLYQLLLDNLKKKGKICKSIRNREIKGNSMNINNSQLFVEQYEASDGQEYFISYESFDRKMLYGFVRLRFNQNKEKNDIEDLINCALIRELHVYGNVIPVADKIDSHAQNIGYGKKLMNIAEKIAIYNNYQKIAVISSIGTRGYYKKIGYNLEGTYMIKKLYHTYSDRIYSYIHVNYNEIRHKKIIYMCIFLSFFAYLFMIYLININF